MRKKIIELNLEALKKDVERINKSLDSASNFLDQKDFEKGDFFREKAIIDQNHVFSRERLKDSEAAIERILNGSYGICAECGMEISEDRLIAIPCADKCTSCQARKGLRVR